MLINEILEPQQLDEFNLRQGLATAAIAGSLALASTGFKTHSSVKADPQLTSLGRDTIQTLPLKIRKYIGDPNTIIFVRGIPKGGDPNAVCQVGKGERIIYVNPKYVRQFIDGAADQLADHEYTHMAQSNMPSDEQKKWPATNMSDKYGYTSSPDAWKILKAARAKGDRMWNHSREEQAMIVQQREAQIDLIKNVEKGSYPNKDQLIKDAQQKIAVYNEYIGDYE